MPTPIDASSQPSTSYESPASTSATSAEPKLKNPEFYTDEKMDDLVEAIYQNENKLLLKKTFAIFNPKVDRYPNVTGNDDTRVDDDLNANYLSSEEDGRRIAIVGSYPLPESLENFFDVLYYEKPAVVVCLTQPTVNLSDPSRTEPEYFSVGTDAFGSGPEGEEEHAHIDVDTYAVGTEQFGELQAEHRDMSIRNTAVDFKNRVSIPMLYISNWPDQTAPSLESLKSLALYLNKVKKETGGIPWIHCSGGVGRAGMLAFAMRIFDPDDTASLETMMTEGQKQRHVNIGWQNPEQMKLLIECAKHEGKALLKIDEVDSPQRPSSNQDERLFASDAVRKINTSFEPSSSKTTAISTPSLKRKADTDLQSTPSKKANIFPPSPIASSSSTCVDLEASTENSVKQFHEYMERLIKLFKTTVPLEFARQLHQKESTENFYGLAPLLSLLEGPSDNATLKEIALHHRASNLASQAFLTLLRNCVDESHSSKEIESVLDILCNSETEQSGSLNKTASLYTQILRNGYSESLKSLEHLLRCMTEKLGTTNHPKIQRIRDLFIHNGFRNVEWQPQRIQQDNRKTSVSLLSNLAQELIKFQRDNALNSELKTNIAYIDFS